MSEEWLARTDETLAFYRKLRDEFEPGKPFWNTETADTACGGNPWGGTFLDTFRYLDQLGRLAKQEVHVVAHNTLVASDYGLLDEKTLTPKPNYWGALLWRSLMGTTVLESGIQFKPVCMFMRIACAAVLAALRCWRLTTTVPHRAQSLSHWGRPLYIAAGNLDSRRVH